MSNTDAILVDQEKEKVRLQHALVRVNKNGEFYSSTILKQRKLIRDKYFEDIFYLEGEKLNFTSGIKLSIEINKSRPMFSKSYR